ncbi:MAG TPA: GAP family protein [Solirubrobacteraceae bacterium]|nr:GAP family protein [Solirubrobacteraceae bacterium]
MPALALAVILIAAPDSLNPSLIVAAVFLTLGAHPVRRSLVFTITAFVITLAGGLAIALGLGDLILSLLPKLSHTAKYDVIVAVGVLVICGGAVLWWRRKALASEPSDVHRDPGGSAVLLGAGIAGVELLTAFPYFAAIAMVIGSSVAAPGKVFLLVLYNVIYVLPLIAIVVVRAIMGEKGSELLVPVSAWIETHWPVVAAPVAVVVGAALTAYGIVQLT